MRLIINIIGSIALAMFLASCGLPPPQTGPARTDQQAAAAIGGEVPFVAAGYYMKTGHQPVSPRAFEVAPFAHFVNQKAANEVVYLTGLVLHRPNLSRAAFTRIVRGQDPTVQRTWAECPPVFTTVGLDGKWFSRHRYTLGDKVEQCLYLKTAGMRKAEAVFSLGCHNPIGALIAKIMATIVGPGGHGKPPVVVCTNSGCTPQPPQPPCTGSNCVPTPPTPQPPGCTGSGCPTPQPPGCTGSGCPTPQPPGCTGNGCSPTPQPPGCTGGGCSPTPQPPGCTGSGCTPPPCPDCGGSPPPQPPPAPHHDGCNNGWGNNSQCSPGNSLQHNNAENYEGNRENGTNNPNGMGQAPGASGTDKGNSANAPGQQGGHASQDTTSAPSNNPNGKGHGKH